MKKILNKKNACLIAVCALVSSICLADDFDDFGSFEDSFSSAGQNTVSVTGKASSDVRAYIDNGDNAEQVEVKAIPEASLGFSYDGKMTDAKINIKLNEDIILNHPVDVIDEVSVAGYFGNFSVEIGKIKTVWGKGDKLHVIDNFNADDYTDFIVPEYIDRRIATPMIKLGVDFGFSNLHLEGIYTPLLPTDRFARKGIWTPAVFSSLEKNVKTSATAQVESAFSSYNAALIQASVIAGNASATEQQKAYAQQQLTVAASNYMTVLTNANSLNASPDSIYPDMMTLKYGQFGARLTGTAGPVDFGVSYYNGYYKQPSFNADKMQTWVSKTLYGTADESDKFLAYDKKQTFGLEAAATVWRFNLRAEAAYNLTEDIDGTDTCVHNNSVGWLAGFDIDMPFWNMNINIQETGSYVLNHEQCVKKTSDVDYDNKGNYSKNKIVLNITTSFINDKLVPEVTAIYGIETADLVILPKVSFKATDGFSVYASGLYIWCKDSDSEFYEWRNNSFVNIGACYQF